MSQDNEATNQAQALECEHIYCPNGCTVRAGMCPTCIREMLAEPRRHPTLVYDPNCFDVPPAENRDIKPLGHPLGDCIRCHIPKPGVKLFLLTSNPSFSFGAPAGEGFANPSHCVVCKECLTDEEIAKILAPIACFVLEALYLRKPPTNDAAALVRGLLVHHHAGEEGLPTRARQKALEAL